MDLVRAKNQRKKQKKLVEEEREPGRCALFIQKRGRYCRLAVARGSKYCGEHLNFDPDQSHGLSATSERRRIPCPLDPHQYADRGTQIRMLGFLPGFNCMSPIITAKCKYGFLAIKYACAMTMGATEDPGHNNIACNCFTVQF